MTKPILIATIVVWAAVLALFLFYVWRHSRKPQVKPTKERPDK